MDEQRIIRSLKLQLYIERTIIAFIAIVLFALWARGQINNTKSLIVVDGKAVACVPSEADAMEILQQVKKKTGCDPAEIEFKEDVVVTRAPRNARPVSRHKAMRTVERVLSPVVPRWAIIVDGKPVVALPSRTIAGEVLDLAKFKFGKLAVNLAEEPQFKENVTVDIAPVNPEIYCKTAAEAIERLFAPAERSTQDSIYTVKKGDIAASIAARHGISLEKLWTLNPGVNLHKLQVGDKIRVRTTKPGKPKLTVIVRDQFDRVETIPAPVRQISSAELYVGKSMELTPGRSGLRKIRVAAIYENGRKTGSEIISEEILRKPIPRKIAVGIKPRP
jgi:LysM repeat protein